ncbi:hypothetical protein [Niabella aurantiaca]|uniref:hypothetical protein n=1 Tax=Niabella aurantiaca TaxID=379900 RepID=UPI00036D9FE5|nr:hypothetical protein [Niabella aurantiaca]
MLMRFCDPVVSFEHMIQDGDAVDIIEGKTIKVQYRKAAAGSQQKNIRTIPVLV